MNSSLRFSFFITKDMKVDLQPQQLKGTLPILYVFLARATNSSRKWRLFRSMAAAPFRKARPAGAGRRECASVISIIDRARSRRFSYFTTDLSDGGIASSPGFLSFCGRFGVGCKSAKSSSYLMFEERLRAGSQFHSRSQPDHYSGRRRHSSGRFQSRQMEHPPFWQLPWSDRNFQTILSAQIAGTLRA